MNPELPLRDIHLPEAISWWPPAPGWWISAILAIAVITLAVRLFRRRARYLAPYKSAQHELQQIKSHYENGQDAQLLSQELSVLLRRISMTIAPREESAGLTGDHWLSFLDSLVNQSLFNTEAGRQLISAPYQPTHTINGSALIDLTEQWLTQINKAPRRSHA